MLKTDILENVTSKYLLEIEKNQEFRAISYKLDKQIQYIYKKYGDDIGENIEDNIWILIGIMGENMYIKGLKDGINL